LDGLRWECFSDWNLELSDKVGEMVDVLVERICQYMQDVCRRQGGRMLVVG